MGLRYCGFALFLVRFYGNFNFQTAVFRFSTTRRFAVCVNFRSRLSVKIWSNIYLRCYDSTGSSHVAYIGLFLTTYTVIGIHRVIFVMEIRTSSIDECNFRICTAVSVF